MTLEEASIALRNVIQVHQRSHLLNIAIRFLRCRTYVLGLRSIREQWEDLL